MPVLMPSDFNRVTIRGRFVAFDGQPLNGTITFSPQIPDLIASNDTIVLATAIQGKISDGQVYAADGVSPLQVFSTDDPDVSRRGWTYKVTESLNGRAARKPYSIEVPEAASEDRGGFGLDLSVVGPSAPSSGNVSSYVLLPAFTALSQKVDLLSGGGGALVTEQGLPAALDAQSVVRSVDGKVPASLLPEFSDGPGGPPAADSITRDLLSPDVREALSAVGNGGPPAADSITAAQLSPAVRAIVDGAVELDSSGRLPRALLPDGLGGTPAADSITSELLAPELRTRIASGGVGDASLTPAQLAPVLATRVEVPKFVPQDQTTLLGLPAAYVRDSSPTITRAQVGLDTIYWPYLVRVPDSEYARLPQFGRWRLYCSTDHDTGAGGVAMLKTDALLPGASDTVWTSVKAPNGSSKILVGGGGDQMETPTVVFNPETRQWHAYVQVEEPRREGVTPQSTALYVSDDGVTGWSKVPGAGIPNPGSDWLGWRHTGYCKVWYIDGQWVAWSLSGGGDQSTYGWAYSNDGFTWVLDRRRILTSGTFGGPLSRLGVSTLLMFRGRLWAFGLMVSYASGATGDSSQGRRAWAAPMNDDLLSPAGKIQTLPFVIDPSLPQTVGLGSNVAAAADGSLWSAYRTGDAKSSIRFMEVR